MSASSLRVLLSPSAYFPHVGGIEEITRNVALELGRRGHDVLVLVNRWPADAPASETLDGVRVRRLPLELPGLRPENALRFARRTPLAAVEFARIARGFDVLHLIGAGPNAVYAAALPTPPVVLTAQGEFRNDAYGSFDRSLSLRWALRRLLATADAVTAPSQFTLRELGPIGARHEVVPNGVAELDASSAKRGYVLAAGRLVPQKGFDVLLEAYARVRDQLRLPLVLAGDGFLRAELEAQARSLGLNGEVRFTGAVDRQGMSELLAGADAFVLPSRHEALPLVLFEAMAAGTPVVASTAGGIAEFARNEDNALVIPPGDVDALGAALVRLVGDAELRDRLARRGRETASELTWERVVDRYERIYREVARA